MARKKTPDQKKPPKAPARPKPPKSDAKPSLTIFGFHETETKSVQDSIESLLPVEFFMEIFEDDDCMIEELEPGIFFAGRDDAYKVVVEVSVMLPFVTFKLPPKVKPGTSKSKVLSWINMRTNDFPMLRLFRSDESIVMSMSEYLYDIEGDLDVDHFLLSVNTFWNLNTLLIRNASDGVLDPEWFPVM